MGSDLKITSKSENINLQMESEIVYLMKDAVDNYKGFDFITKRCQESFGGSWILIYYYKGKGCSFDMSFGFKSLKWIKLKYGSSFLFI